MSVVLDDIAGFLSDVWHTITRLFSSSSPTAVTTGCPHGALTPKQATDWFNRFQSDTSIPWNYPNDCCYTRAHVMAQQLEAAGVNVGKEWNYAPDALHPLLVKTPNDPRGYVTWHYHVAPTVPVVQPDGSVQPMVIDPSIASGPITPQQWKDKQGQSGSTLAPTEGAGTYYRAPDGTVDPTPPPSEVQATFKSHQDERKELWEKAGRNPP